MTDYKLVPVDTLKSIHRDLDACQKVIWMHGGFDPAYWRDAQARLKEIDELLAAPAVQGEPFMYGIASPDGKPHFDENCVSSEAHSLFEEVEALSGDDAGYQVVPLYTAPQPAEQQPAPDVADYEQVLDDHRRLTRELDVLLNGEEGAAQQASLADLVAQLRTVVRNTGKPVLAAPDVGGLVEALEDIAGTHHHSASAGEYFAKVARAAIATHRKQGG